MTFVLLAIIGALLIDRLATSRAVSRDRRELVNAVVARNGPELAALNREPKAKKERPEPEFVDFPVGT